MILNHSAETFSIEAGDGKAKFVLTRFETSDIAEVSDLEQIIRASNDFGVSGV